MTVQRSDQRVPQRPKIRLRTARNRYNIDPSWIPEGMSWEWKRATLLGQEDSDNITQSEMNGWVNVSADRVPDMMGSRAKAGAEVRIGGLVLMERPAELTEESRMTEQFEAREIYAQQMAKVHSHAKAVSPKLEGVRRSAPEFVGDEIE